MKRKAQTSPAVATYGKRAVTQRFAKFTKITQNERRR